MASPVGSFRSWKDKHFWLHNWGTQFCFEGWNPFSFLSISWKWFLFSQYILIWSGGKWEWHLALLASQYFHTFMPLTKKLKIKCIPFNTFSTLFLVSCLEWKDITSMWIPTCLLADLLEKFNPTCKQYHCLLIVGFCCALILSGHLNLSCSKILALLIAVHYCFSIIY